MLSAKEAGGKWHGVKAALTAALFSFIFLIALAGSADAVTISASNFQCFDSVNVGDRYCKVHVDVKATGQYEEGMIELGFNDASPSPLLSFIVQKTPCEQTFPYNTIFKYGVGDAGSFGSVGKDLVARSIPDGTYVPYLIHVTGCFNAGGAFKLPNPDSQIPKTHVVFGAANANEKDECDNPFTALQWVKAHGDLACTSATCSSPETSTSKATCTSRGECADGAEQWQTCSDGSSFRIRLCTSGKWQTTSQKCPTQPPPPPPYDCTAVPPPPECTKGPGDGVNWGKLLLIVGGALFAVWAFRRFGGRFVR